MTPAPLYLALLLSSTAPIAGAGAVDEEGSAVASAIDLPTWAPLPAAGAPRVDGPAPHRDAAPMTLAWRGEVTNESNAKRRRWRPPGRWEQAAGPHRVTPGATGTA